MTSVIYYENNLQNLFNTRIWNDFNLLSLVKFITFDLLVLTNFFKINANFYKNNANFYKIKKNILYKAHFQIFLDYKKNFIVIFFFFSSIIKLKYIGHIENFNFLKNLIFFFIQRKKNCFIFKKL